MAECLEDIEIWKRLPDCQAVIVTSGNEVFGNVSLGEMNRYRDCYEREWKHSLKHDELRFHRTGRQCCVGFGDTIRQAPHVLEKNNNLEDRLRKHPRGKSEANSITREDGLNRNRH